MTGPASVLVKCQAKQRSFMIHGRGNEGLTIGNIYTFTNLEENKSMAHLAYKTTASTRIYSNEKTNNRKMNEEPTTLKEKSLKEKNIKKSRTSQAITAKKTTAKPARLLIPESLTTLGSGRTVKTTEAKRDPRLSPTNEDDVSEPEVTFSNQRKLKGILKKSNIMESARSKVLARWREGHLSDNETIPSDVSDDVKSVLKRRRSSDTKSGGRSSSSKMRRSYFRLGSSGKMRSDRMYNASSCDDIDDVEEY